MTNNQSSDLEAQGASNNMNSVAKTSHIGMLGLLLLLCTAAILVTIPVVAKNQKVEIPASLLTQGTNDSDTVALVKTGMPVTYKTTTVGNVQVYYREAGNPDKPTLLLLHGFPSSSHQYRDLIPLLSDDFHLVAPDYPAFGSTVASEDYEMTFDNIGSTMADFVDAINLTRFHMYIFDYGAPIGMRIALRYPERVDAIVTQNGNVYTEGLSPDGFAPSMAYWANNTQENRDALRGFLTLDTTRFQYTFGAPEDRLNRIGEDAILHDQAILDRDNEVQLDLFYDYRTNVEQYPEWQAYLREYQPKMKAIWASNDPFFIPAGAEAFRTDVPGIEIEYVDAGHFALETHAPEIAESIRQFLSN